MLRKPRRGFLVRVRVRVRLPGEGRGGVEEECGARVGTRAPGSRLGVCHGSRG